MAMAALPLARARDAMGVKRVRKEREEGRLTGGAYLSGDKCNTQFITLKSHMYKIKNPFVISIY